MGSCLWLFVCCVSGLVVLCRSASEGSVCPAGLGESCVCRRPVDCFFQTSFPTSPTTCCDRGLVCCRQSGVSEKKCAEFSRLVGEGPALCPALALPLVVGGDEAVPGQVPHMALLGFGQDTVESAQWLCGGALVSERWVLTAAHCVRGPKQGPARWVRLGAWLDGAAQDDDAQQLDVLLGLAHPGYRPPARYNDIGLLLLAEEPALGPGVRPACLHRDFPIPGKKAQACGYGRVYYDADNAGDALRCVWLPLLPRVDCAKHFRDEMGAATLPRGLPRSLLCAADLRGGKDTCQGDSGGPLHILPEDPYCTYSLVGVTSFGKFCGFPNSPGVYTRVSHFVPWIESIIWSREVRAAESEGISPIIEYGTSEIWLRYVEDLSYESPSSGNNSAHGSEVQSTSPAHRSTTQNPGPTQENLN